VLGLPERPLGGHPPVREAPVGVPLDAVQDGLRHLHRVQAPRPVGGAKLRHARADGVLGHVGTITRGTAVAGARLPGMQRTRAELEAMSHEELVNRVLELQDMLREGLAVRDSLHAVLNTVLNAKAEEVARYADAPDATLDPEELELKRAWAAARHAVSNPLGAARKRAQAGAAF